MADEESRDAHTACEEGNLRSVQFNVKHNSSFDINAPDCTGRTCLMLAAEAGHEKIVEFLIQNHANVTKQDKINKRSAIHLACRKVRRRAPGRRRLFSTSTQSARSGYAAESALFFPCSHFLRVHLAGSEATTPA